MYIHHLCAPWPLCLARQVSLWPPRVDWLGKGHRDSKCKWRNWLLLGLGTYYVSCTLQSHKLHNHPVVEHVPHLTQSGCGYFAVLTMNWSHVVSQGEAPTMYLAWGLLYTLFCICYHYYFSLVRKLGYRKHKIRALRHTGQTRTWQGQQPHQGPSESKLQAFFIIRHGPEWAPTVHSGPLIRAALLSAQACHYTWEEPQKGCRHIKGHPVTGQLNWDLDTGILIPELQPVRGLNVSQWFSLLEEVRSTKGVGNF